MPTTRKKEHDLNDTEFAKAMLAKFSASVRAWMELRKLDYFQVGQRVGCSGYQIRHMLRLENFPSVPVYWALCREMGVNPLPPLPK